MQFNLAALMPQLMAALRPGANLKELARSMGIEVLAVKPESPADFESASLMAIATATPGAETIFIHGKPALLNGRQVRIMAVLGDFPEGAEVPVRALTSSGQENS